MKKKYPYIQLLLIIVILILEMLPYSSALYFQPGPDMQPRASFFSFFSLMNLGYGKFDCVIVSVFSCILLVLCLCYVKWQRKELLYWIRVICGLAVFSLTAGIIFFGVYVGHAYTILGYCIEGLLILLFIGSIIEKGEKIQEKN